MDIQHQNRWLYDNEVEDAGLPDAKVRLEKNSPELQAC